MDKTAYTTRKNCTLCSTTQNRGEVESARHKRNEEEDSGSGHRVEIRAMVRARRGGRGRLHALGFRRAAPNFLRGLWSSATRGVVENDRLRNGNREALTALRKKARTTKTSVPSPFESIMKEIGVLGSKPLIPEVCTTCENHDPTEDTWMMLPETDIFAVTPFHAAHTILERGALTYSIVGRRRRECGTQEKRRRGLWVGPQGRNRGNGAGKKRRMWKIACFRVSMDGNVNEYQEILTKLEIEDEHLLLARHQVKFLSTIILLSSVILL
ncbi:hypothetical protein Cgig2_017023 [Carnegiea gigantea]|uniref:Uncharacterized protein n=1 Tax=Carnegiea gigantea TaxID=171969 RepID=A0A9Q1KHD0_9CARY|nr:hypothetical protein Cgig2_017023 [Carnegiea gigantea]